MDHLSVSQINLYSQCSLKYKFQYIDELPRPFKSSGLAFGSAIHSVISWFHKEKMAGKEVSLERFYRIFDADWYCQKVGTEIRHKNGETEMNLVVMAKEMLNLYFERPMDAKGVDVSFTIPLTDPGNGKALDIPLEGIIDLVERDDTIVEFKTSAQTIGSDEVNDHLQLTAYSYVYETLYRRPPKLLKIVNFVKTKKPKLIVSETKRTKSDYQRFFHLAGQVLRGIRSSIFFPRQSFMCKDCEYGGNCKAWGGD